MIQNIGAPAEQTIIFTLIFAVIFFFFLRRKKEPLTFSLLITSELKGFAILIILLGHIGYFLVSDNHFLYPLSTISGVGVDLFFLLSGYGLALSSQRKNYKPWEFYKRRIGKIFIPLWITIILFFVLDATLLHRFYDWQVIFRSFLGLYPSADIYNDFNSPLWYLTPLLLYYLVFPWVFKPKRPLISAIIFGVIGAAMLLLPLPINGGVYHLYKLHYLAFPLGIALTGLSKNRQYLEDWIKKHISSHWILEGMRYFFLILCGGIFIFTANQDGKSEIIIQLMSLICSLSIAGFFIATKLKFKLLEIFGNYSYEIYLLHWPLLYRYNFLYPFLPAGISTALYLGILLLFAWIFQKTIMWCFSRKGAHQLS